MWATTCIALLIASTSLAANVPDIANDLLPRPQLVESHDGTLTLTPDALSFVLRTPTADAAAALGARLAEVQERLNLRYRTYVSECPSPEPYALVILGGAAAPAVTRPDLPAEGCEEGYVLQVTANGIVVTAMTERGLFYGLMTAEQLLNAAQARHVASIPCMRIVDWPKLAMRGFHEDYGRDQLPTVEDHKRTIRTLAQYKVNTHLWFIESDHFVYKFDPSIGEKYDRFTFDELREVATYAKQYYIEVIPVVELLAHMENTLNDPKYADLAEVKGSGTLCPTCEDSFALVRNMIDEIASAFDGQYFHCGLDESSAVGQGRSAEAVKAKGIERVYADYYSRLNDLVRSHGKTMMMYADIVLNHPKVMDLLPKDIVMMFWDYGDGAQHPGFEALMRGGFTTVSLSGMWDWANLYPMYDLAFKNIERLAAETAKVGAHGTFVSDWGDWNLGAAGANLSELNYYGVVYCGAQGWRPEAIPFEAFSKAFAAQFFGIGAADEAQAFTLLAKAQGEGATWNRRARLMFHGVPSEQIPAMAKAPAEELAFWRNLKQSAEQAHLLIKKTRPRHSRDYLHSFDLAAQMLAFAAEQALQFRATAEALNAGHLDGEKEALAYEALRDRQQALWLDYRAVYAATNKPKNLQYLVLAWDKSQKDLTQLIKDLRSGEILKLKLQ